MKHIQFHNAGGDGGGTYCVQNYYIQYSDDGVNWYNETDMQTNTYFGGGAYWTADITNPVPSLYKRIYITSSNRSGTIYCNICNIEFQEAYESDTPPIFTIAWVSDAQQKYCVKY